MKEIEIKAGSVEQAVAEGLIELGAARDMVEVEVISKPTLFKKAVVKLILLDNQDSNAKQESDMSAAAKAEPVLDDIDITNRDNSPAIEEKRGSQKIEQAAKSRSTDENDQPIIAFLRELLDKMGLSYQLDITSGRDKLELFIRGEDTTYAIGFRGETLDAIQYLTLLKANRSKRFSKRLIVDAEGYREKRAETLTALSKKLAGQAIKSGKAIELEPMNPFERRVIHTALQDNPMVTTVSEGDEPNRFVVICPVKEETTYDNENKAAFKKQGFGKTRSFGQKKRRF